jgi:hypothetical protein
MQHYNQQSLKRGNSNMFRKLPELCDQLTYSEYKSKSRNESNYQDGITLYYNLYGTTPQKSQKKVSFNLSMNTLREYEINRDGPMTPTQEIYRRS